MKVKVELKNFALDTALQEPIAVMKESGGERILHLPLNAFDLPKILSLHYKVREDKHDLLHIIHRMHNSNLVKLLKIRIFYKNGLSCIVTYRVLFLFSRKFLLNTSEALLLSLVTEVPIYVSDNVFHAIKHDQQKLSPYDAVKFKEVLEKWDPGKADANIQ